MSPTRDLKVLVPVDVSEGSLPDREVLGLLAPAHVVLLGYYPVPSQAAPAQLKRERESEAARTLSALAGEVETDEVTEVLVFTGDREDTVDRVAEEQGCDAVLTPGETRGGREILVALRSETNLERIVEFVAELVRGTGSSVTLFHAAGGESPSEGEFLLRGAADRLREAGVDPGAVEWRLSEGEAPDAALRSVAGEYDLVVLGETEPSLRERILGDVVTGVIDETDRPTVVVRDP